MSNGINQNATSYTTASVQEEGLLYPVPRAVLCLGQSIPPRQSLGSQAPQGTGEQDQDQPVPCPRLLHWVRWRYHRGPVCALPQPPGLLQLHKEQNGFLGAITSPCASPGSSQVTWLAAILCNGQQYKESMCPGVLRQERVSSQQDAGMWVPVVLCPPTASETPGDACQQRGPAEPTLMVAAPRHRRRFLTPAGPKGWPCPCPSCNGLPAVPRTPGRLSDSPMHAGLCPVNICGCSFRNVFHAPIV